MAEVWYVVDAKHGVPRSCDNCALARWNRTRIAYRCPYLRGAGRTLAFDRPCWNWQLVAGVNVINSETGEVKKA